MRKVALKKQNPDRHRIIKMLRESPEIKEIMTRNGKEVVLNVKKHYLFKKAYKNEEYNKEIFRTYNTYV